MKKKNWFLIKCSVLLIIIALLTKLSIYFYNLNEISNHQRIYSSVYDFDYNNILYASNKAFEILKEEHSKINFISEFKEGNLEVYDFYKEKYKELVKNRRKFIDKKTGEEFYLNEYSSIKYFFKDGYNEQDYIFRFFDVDDDGNPELCISISENTTYMCVFKYIAESDEFILWKELNAAWFHLAGTKATMWIGGGISKEFCKLHEDTNIDYVIIYHSIEYYSKEKDDGDMAYMVALPIYFDKNKNVEIQWITEYMKNQSYFIEGTEQYYFRLTKEQYVDITNVYEQEERKAMNKLQELKLTYDELFND